MHNVLMILYYFPPLGGIGTLRSLGHVKHLPALGWKPYVLSVRESTRLGVIDETLVGKVPSDVELFRTNFLDIRRPFQIFSYLPFFKLSRYLSQAYRLLPPDHFIGWIPFSYNKAIKIIARDNIDALYTLSSPYSSHLIGLLLKKKLKIPWVADFGDEWTRNPFKKTLYRLQIIFF